MKKIYLINRNREREPFSFRKLYRSLRRAGAGPSLAFKIAKQIEKEAFWGAKTSWIHNRVKKLLKREAPRLALKYHLKEAMRKLGPSGFPFEKFVAEILSKNGFKVALNQHLWGACQVKYEIDFLAQNKNLIFIGECKFHHLASEKVDLKVALYNYARFLDLKKSLYFRNLAKKNFSLIPMLVTNTKFSWSVKKYSQCVGLKLLGWRYPKDKGLEYLIETQKLYPITILPSFKGFLKEIFASSKIMLVEDLLEIKPEKLSQKLNLSLKTILPLVKEAKLLLSS